MNRDHPAVAALAMRNLEFRRADAGRRYLTEQDTEALAMRLDKIITDEGRALGDAAEQLVAAIVEEEAPKPPPRAFSRTEIIHRLSSVFTERAPGPFAVAVEDVATGVEEMLRLERQRALLDASQIVRAKAEDGNDDEVAALQQAQAEIEHLMQPRYLGIRPIEVYVLAAGAGCYVRHGDRWAEHLCRDEALWAVACELQGITEGGFLLTDEQHAAARKALDTSPPDPRGAAC